MCSYLTRSSKHTLSALICLHSRHQSYPKPLSIIYNHTHASTCIHKHREQERGVGGRSWSCQREGNQSCNSRAYRRKRVRPYLTRQHAEYVNLYMNAHKKERGRVLMHLETHMHKWWDNSLQYFWKICPHKCQDTDPSPKVSITNTQQHAKDC